MHDQKTAITIPEDLLDGLARIAERTGRTEAAVLREAIEAYLDDLEPPIVESIGSASDPGLNARNVREWLDRNYDAR